MPGCGEPVETSSLGEEYHTHSFDSSSVWLQTQCRASVAALSLIDWATNLRPCDKPFSLLHIASSTSVACGPLLQSKSTQVVAATFMGRNLCWKTCISGIQYSFIRVQLNCKFSLSLRLCFIHFILKNDIVIQLRNKVTFI